MQANSIKFYLEHTCVCVGINFPTLGHTFNHICFQTCFIARPNDDYIFDCLQKGFPVEMTLDDLIEFFEPHGGESVMLRYDAKKNFKVII